VQFNLFGESRQPFVEFGGEPARETLGFSQCQLAEFRSRARDGSARERRRFDRQPHASQFCGNSLGVFFTNICQQRVLLNGHAQIAIAEFVGKLGRAAQLWRRDSSAQHRSTDENQSGLFLR
jgi:hypothetical protein